MLRYIQVGQLFSSVFPALWLRGFKTVLWDAHTHPLIPLLGCNLLLMMKLEYTLHMVGPGKQPFDVGFQYTAGFHDYLKERPWLNTVTATINTAFVFFQVGYFAWAWIVEGRKRATLAALLLYTCRGLMGYSTQLPLPQEFLGSELDFPVEYEETVRGEVPIELMINYTTRQIGWIQACLDRWAIVREVVQMQVQQRRIADLNGAPSGGPLVVLADLRYDSTRNGYNGTWVFIDASDGRVIEFVNLARTETENNSWLIEDRVFEIGIQGLVARNIVLDEVVHDDKSSVDVILARYGIVRQKDLWHKCKNVIKKFVTEIQNKKRAPPGVINAEVKADLELLTVRQLGTWLRENGHQSSRNKGVLM